MRVATLAIAVVCSVAQIQAQMATGSIVGRVTDPLGAVLVGVEVTALNPAKGITSRATTDETGIYRVLYLEPAAYNLTFSRPGASAACNGQVFRSGLTTRSLLTRNWTWAA